MSDTIIILHATDFSGIANEVHQHELLRTLTDLKSNNGKNYAIYSDPDFAPQTGIVILSFPSVGPLGSAKICDGDLLVGPNVQKVSAYRLA